MATYNIVTNKIGTRAVLRINGNTNISVNTLSVGAGESVRAATLTSIFYTSNGAAADAYYRANTANVENCVLRLLPNDHAYMDFAGVGIAPDFDNRTANIVFIVNGANTSTIIAEFHKISAANTDY
jgi:hypothetical protein